MSAFAALATERTPPPPPTFEQVIVRNLVMSGIYHTSKGHIKIVEATETEARYHWQNGGKGKKKTYTPDQQTAGIVIAGEWETPDNNELIKAAAKAAESGHQMLIACAFEFEPDYQDASPTIPIIRARINPELQMGDIFHEDGNLFVAFANPVISITQTDDDKIIVDVKAESISTWTIDTNYTGKHLNTGAHAYFVNVAHDPYKRLKIALKDKIDAQAWESITKTTSRPFPKPKTGFIAVKVTDAYANDFIKIFHIPGLTINT